MPSENETKGRGLRSLLYKISRPKVPRQKDSPETPLPRIPMTGRESQLKHLIRPNEKAGFDFGFDSTKSDDNVTPHESTVPLATSFLDPTTSATDTPKGAVPSKYRSAMFVRALFDYDDADSGILSFNEGDIIQVITILESGWWDGVLNSVRGWFPSNFCVVIPAPADAAATDDDNRDMNTLGETAYNGSDTKSAERKQDTESIEEEAAFWIPQATPDGRLFYFNSLTGERSMFLPLETPSLNENRTQDLRKEPMPPTSGVIAEDPPLGGPSVPRDRANQLTLPTRGSITTGQNMGNSNMQSRFSAESTDDVGPTNEVDPQIARTPTRDEPQHVPHHDDDDEEEVNTIAISRPMSDTPVRLENLTETYGWKSEHQVYGPSDKEPVMVCNTLGHGSLGIVDEVKTKEGLPSFVRKRVQLHIPGRRGNLKIIREEAEALRSLTHPHIVTIIGSYEASKQNRKHFYCLLMSPVGDNDLRAFLDIVGEEEHMDHKSQWRDWIRTWFGCLASALAYMHDQGIRHQDIKPSNIVHKGKNIFFTDFSSSCRFNVGHTTSTENPSSSTPMYSAPEVVEKFSETGTLRKHGRGSDIFALGCVFCDMLSVLYGKPVAKFQRFLLAENARDSYNSDVVASRALLYSKMIDRISAWFEQSQFFEVIIAPMLMEDRALRPSADKVLKRYMALESVPLVQLQHAVHYCSCKINLVN